MCVQPRFAQAIRSYLVGKIEKGRILFEQTLYAEASGPVIFFLIFTSIVLHLLVSNCFWHFAHFQNAQRHAIQLYIFLVFMSLFGILPIFEMSRCMWSGHIFSGFYGRPQKSYPSKFQKCYPTEI